MRISPIAKLILFPYPFGFDRPAEQLCTCTITDECVLHDLIHEEA